MSEEISSFYSTKELKNLQNNGVIIPDLNSVKIGREILPEKISSGTIIYPFVRINGEKTDIHSGSKIGISGPVTIKNSWLGENVVVGNLGPVTLKDVVLGPGSILGSGIAEDAVFLGKETFINNFSTGYGFRLRKGTLFEEDSSSGQHTDTKMTILFPWATLGSNINFCDIILTGGTGPEMGNFSEIGSGTIHFNYTIRGDKATASIFGDVNQGVFLNRDRIFIGGNNSLLGPVKSDFGAMTAANARINGYLSVGLNFGRSMPYGMVEYDPKIFKGVLEIVSNQVNFISGLAALIFWYKQIRICCIAKTPEERFIYSSGLKIVIMNFEERLLQLGKFLDGVQTSLNMNHKIKKIPKKEILDQIKIIEKWPLIEKKLSNLNDFEIEAPDSLKSNIKEIQSEGDVNYTTLIKKIPKKEKKSGNKWLNNISMKVKETFNLIKNSD